MTDQNRESENEDGACIAIAQDLPHPAPDIPVLLRVQEFENYQIALIYDPTGRISAVVAPLNEAIALAQVTSCPLILPEVPRVVLMVCWKPPNQLDLYIDGKLVGSSTKQNECVSVLDLSEITLIKDQTNFAQQNEQERKRRRGTLAGMKPRLENSAGAKERHFYHLSTGMQQLSEMLSFVREGRDDYAFVISTLLRKMVSMGKPLAALQLCAAHLDEPLIVYTCPHPETPLPIKGPAGHLSLNISGDPVWPLSNPIDIDVWLKQPGAQFEATKYSHEKVLNAIGNTEGAHLSVEIEQLVQMLQTGWTSADQASLLKSDMTRYLYVVGEAVLQLGTRFLQKISS
jgi:hypothetical protein